MDAHLLGHELVQSILYGGVFEKILLGMMSPKLEGTRTVDADAYRRWQRTFSPLSGIAKKQTLY
jgi:hypothetical protein